MKHIWQLVLSCEHAGNQVPEEFARYFVKAKKVLQSHRGWDIGAAKLASELSAELNVASFYHSITRLLIEINRSLSHHHLWSTYTKNLSEQEKAEILKRYYYPYRDEVTCFIEQQLKSNISVLHISVHSFTPVLKGKKRQADIGLLYDPANKRDAAFCYDFKKALEKAMPNWKIKMNYPYKGISDSFTTVLRDRFKYKPYIGVELETNQALWALHPGTQARYRRIIACALRETLTAFGKGS